MFSPAKLSGLQYALQSLWYYRRVNLAVLLGVVAATAVLTGALVVGDSVRGSLKRLTIERLGRIDQILLADHFFDESLSNRIKRRRPDLAGFTEAEPVILLVQASVEHAPSRETVFRSNEVTVVGCDDGFWQLSDLPVRPQKLPRARQIVLNAPLAQHLHVQCGDRVVLRLGKVGGVAPDSTLARKSDLIQNLAELEVVDIIPAEGLGRFSLRANQALPRNAYLPREILQQAMDEPNKVNAILLASGDAARSLPTEAVEDLQNAVWPTMEDAGLRLDRVVATFEGSAEEKPRTAFEYFNLTSDRMLIPSDAEQGLRRHLADWHLQSVLTYLANSLEKVNAAPSGSGGIPYSTVSAVESSNRLGPLITADRTPIPVGDNEVVLNEWAAQDLQARPGDSIRLTYFEPETTHGQPEERSATLTLKAILPLTTPATPYRRNRPASFRDPPTWANDPDLTPQVKGVTDQESIDDWDPPFPFDYSRIRKPTDEDYWDEYRTTPKAFLSKSTGERLWGNRFGNSTSIRIAIDEAVTEANVRKRVEVAVHDDLKAFGFSLLPVKRDGLQAAAGTTPFQWLFLGFSSFIIAAALMLIALLFRLSVEQRAANAGLLLAVGFARRTVSRLFLLEGVLLSLVGSVLGVLAGIGYASLMLAGLRTLWLRAVVTPFLRLSVAPLSLLIGCSLGLIAALVTIWWTLRGLRRVSERQLLAGRAQPESCFERTRPIRGRWIPEVLFVLAVALGIGAVSLRGEAQAGAFFGSGACVLTGLLIRISQWFREQDKASAKSRLSPLGVAVRNVARHPGRSTLAIGLMAAACFLIVAISAFRLDPSQAGAGGFALIAQSELPIFENLNEPNVRRDLLGSKADLLSGTRIVSLRLHDGDDASCRNLYQTQQPRLLGATGSFIEHFAQPNVPDFAWADTAREKAATDDNPWKLLEQKTGNAIPVILDKNTAVYSLHLYRGIGEEFELDYGSAGRLRFRVVGLLSNSILQGSLVISEANLLHRFPQTSGYRFFLIDCPKDRSMQVSQTLEDRFSDPGLVTTDTHELLSDLLAVQNTYLLTFQSLGGLGLLLGTLGLVAVQLRSVFERRGELALLRAVGFAPRRVASLVMLEHLLVLLSGLGVGLLAALVAVLPHLWTGGARPPVGTLSVVLSLILAVGLVSGATAVRKIAQTPVLDALRGE